MTGFLRRSVQCGSHPGYGAAAQVRNVTFAFLLATSGAATAEPVTVVALGDSLTAGYGLPADQGFVPQLQAWLTAAGADAVVENAGVSGDTTAGGLARIDWTLGPETDALIVTLGGNDMLRGIPPAEVRTNLDGILQAAGTRGLPVLLVGMKAPGNYGPDYKADFDAVYPELAAAHGTLLADSFFGGLLARGADPSDPAALAAFMQADGIHPNAQGVAVIVETLGPQVLALIGQAGG
jgi:acyl-CoA thioesterase I